MKKKENAFLVSTFRLGQTLWGIDTLDTQEIIKPPDITRVYSAPEYVAGIINLRGKIVTIIDLGKKMDVPHDEEGENRRIIIVKWKEESLGLLVDSVADVIKAERSTLLPPPSFASGAKGNHFEGVYHFGNMTVTILDINGILGTVEEAG